MNPNHFRAIQTRRDCFRNCAGGIGAGSLCGALANIICFGSGCQTAHVEAAPDMTELCTAIMDNLLDQKKYCFVKRQTCPLNESVKNRAALIKYRRHDLTSLIEELETVNAHERSIRTANRQGKNYELVNEWPDHVSDNQCVACISFPAFDADTGLGLVVVTEDGLLLNGWERVALFRYEGGRLIELRNRVIWVS